MTPIGRDGATLLALVVLVSGCGPSSRSGGGAAGLATPAASTTSSGAPFSTTIAPAASAVAPLPAPSAPVDVVPIVLIHGHTADPSAWKPLVERIGAGRVVLEDVYAKDAEARAPLSLPPALVVSAGYYKEERTAAKYDLDPATGRGRGSIGGCPVPRDDGLPAWYPASFVDRVRRIVGGVRRATGAPRVDLVLHSMGNLVGRAYTRWASVDPATGRSCVRRMLYY